jgi:hypothetical protein
VAFSFGGFSANKFAVTGANKFANTFGVVKILCGKQRFSLKSYLCGRI